MDGPHQKGGRREHPWWQVMSLTGVGYFSTLGCQPGIAALAAGALSPVATLLLVPLTLLGAVPVYRFVARGSPHGEGATATLEHLLGWWTGELFVLARLGFVATDFVVTMTPSAAAHPGENLPAGPLAKGHEVGVTLLLPAPPGGVFLRGFREAVGLAVLPAAVYLLLNAVVVGVWLAEGVRRPEPLGDWRRSLWAGHGSPWGMALVAVLVFPKLALGLSGFETGVAVMPLGRGDPGDTEAKPVGRVRNTRRLLVAAAVRMSMFLFASSRTPAFPAHGRLGEWFGTASDLSTIAILWFAGAIAMAGLLNIIPRYLPRYGTASEWTRAARPLVLVYTAVAFVTTWLWDASVGAQGGAFATGV